MSGRGLAEESVRAGPRLAPTPVWDRIRHEARVSGLKESGPSLEAVERRRLELWLLGLAMLVAVSAAAALLSAWPDRGVEGWWLSRRAIGIMLLVLSVGFAAYAVEKELHLKRLAALLTEEQSWIATLARELQGATDLLEVSRLKWEFAAIVSTELRAPLRSILHGVARLRTLRPGPEEEILEGIEGHAREVLSLVERVLGTVRRSTGSPPTAPQPVDLGTVAQVVARELEAAWGPIRVEAPAASVVLGEAEALRRVLTCLLDNAHRHGRPPVRVEIERGEDRVVLSVIDSGPGVSLPDRELIFESPAHRDLLPGHPPMGSSLSIARAVVTALRGSLWVEDADTGGAAFRMSLPAYGPASLGGGQHEEETR